MENKKKCLVIFTPFSKKGKIGKYTKIIKSQLEQKYEVTLYKTKSIKDATITAKEQIQNYDLYVVAGGDGLINEVVNGMMQADTANKPKLGILPMGTVNDIAHSFGIKVKVVSALDIILNGKSYLIDVVKVNDHYSTYVCAMGEYTSSSFQANQEMKKKIGWVAYFIEAIKGLFVKKRHNFEVKVNNKQLVQNSCFTMIINSRRVAGFMLNRQADLNDGAFDVVCFDCQKKRPLKEIRKYYNYLRMFLFGIDSIKKSQDVKIVNTDNLSIVNKSMSALNIDGEYIEPSKNIDIKVVKSAITIIAP